MTKNQSVEFESNTLLFNTFNRQAIADGTPKPPPPFYIIWFAGQCQHLLVND